MGAETDAVMETTYRSLTEVIRIIGPLFLASVMYYSSFYIFMPFLIDILLHAICPGELECPRVIFLTGALQLIIGIGTVVMAPILGGISDAYGRRPVLTLIVYTAVVPAVLLAYSRTTVVVYIWYVAYSVAAILRESGMIPVSLAYVADVVDERRRALAVSLSFSAVSIGFLASQIVALALKYDYQAFWLAAALQTVGAIYVTIFLKETNSKSHLPASDSQSENTVRLLVQPKLLRQSSNLRDSAMTILNSSQLRSIALVDFLNSFCGAGQLSIFMYYLKARFNYGKNEFAEIVLTNGLTGALGQVFVYPFLAHYVGERGALTIALLGTALQLLAYGFAWAWWVPFVAAAMSFFHSCIQPALGTLVSKGVDSDVQGKVQGFMGGVRSAGAISAPLLLTPLAAASLGVKPPLNMRGIPYVILGSAMVVAGLISTGLSSPRREKSKPVQPPVSSEVFMQGPTPPGNFLQIPICPEILSGFTDEGQVRERNT